MIKFNDISILVADDEPELRDLLVEEFAYRGAKVMGVENGKMAWLELSTTHYDVLLSDVRMPGGDGIELVKKISAELPQKPPIFLCSGYTDFTFDEAQKYGVVKILSKPFDIEHIVQVISDKLLSAKKLSRAFRDAGNHRTHQVKKKFSRLTAKCISLWLVNWNDPASIVYFLRSQNWAS